MFFKATKPRHRYTVHLTTIVVQLTSAIPDVMQLLLTSCCCSPAHIVRHATIRFPSLYCPMHACMRWGSCDAHADRYSFCRTVSLWDPHAGLYQAYDAQHVLFGVLLRNTNAVWYCNGTVRCQPTALAHADECVVVSYRYMLWHLQRVLWQ